MWFRRFAPTWLLTGLSLTVLIAPNLAAQTETETAAESVKPDELVRQIETQAAQGGANLAEAIAKLVRVGAWSEAVRWTEKLAESEDASVLADAARQIGPDVLLRLSLREEMTEPARTAITKMSDALKKQNQSRPKLVAAIADLAGDSVDQNLAANRTLLRGGEAAIAEMAGAIGGGLPPAQLSKVLGVLKTFGPEGINALGELALYGSDQVRANALVAFQSIAEQERSLVWSLGAQFASNATPAEKRVASRLTGVSSPAEAADYLADRLAQQRANARETNNSQTGVTVWSITEDRTGVTAVRSTELYDAYRQAYDIAQQLRRLPNLTPTASRSVFSTDLALRVMADLDWGDQDQLDRFSKTYGSTFNTESLLTAVNENRELGDTPAIIGLIRVLETMATEELLYGIGAQRSPLVQAAIDSVSPRVRYEAASVVADLIDAAKAEGKTLHFPGSSEVRRTLSEMASLSDQPSAILIETRPEIAVSQETILGDLGYGVQLATSVNEAERMVAQGGDLRMVVSKIQLSDATAVELVDRIRRLPRGRQVPIVFYSDDSVHPDAIASAELETRSMRWDRDRSPAVFVVPLPGGTSAFADAIAEVESKRRLPALSIGDRSRFRKVAQTALQSVSMRP
ncbi:response regulator [Roseiconus lacunae]|uniref:response regulator n=1 Tax=Roseiconus lacunae TaxID=2605694 RepID=UPI0011F106DA|nr:response regulator [Roseiconus lacunae]